MLENYLQYPPHSTDTDKTTITTELESTNTRCHCKDSNSNCCSISSLWSVQCLTPISSTNHGTKYIVKKKNLSFVYWYAKVNMETYKFSNNMIWFCIMLYGGLVPRCSANRWCWCQHRGTMNEGLLYKMAYDLKPTSHRYECY